MRVDIDLVHAGVRLALDPSSEFLHYLSGQILLDQTFAAEVARLMRPDSQLQVANARTGQVDKKTFMAAYAEINILYQKISRSHLMASADRTRGAQISF